MADIVPQPGSPAPGKSKTGVSFYVWIAMAAAVLVAAVAFFMIRTEHRTRERASAHAQTPPPSYDTEDQPIDFTSDDVQVNTGWSFLAGRHPSVTFTCRLAPSLQSANVVVLCYRPLGVSEWFTVETHPRRDGSCRLTLRDLYRNMPYECFFLASTRDNTVIQSRAVRFNT